MGNDARPLPNMGQVAGDMVKNGVMGVKPYMQGVVGFFATTHAKMRTQIVSSIA
jgi:hypothetical protein